jgi:hypothetical protein
VRIIALVLIALITSSASVAVRAQELSPNLILNGGFELPGLPANTNILYLTDGSTYISGWTAINDTAGQPLFYGNTDLNDAVLNGEYGVVLNQGSGLRTTFRTEFGLFYELGLWLRPDDCNGCRTPAPLRITLNGTVLTLPIESGWSYQAIQFFSTNSVNTVELFNQSSTPDFKRWTIDDVSVRKVQGALLGVRLQPVVTIEGTIGAKYQIQAATNLHAPLWTTLTNITLSNSPTLFLDTNFTGNLQQRVYRAIRVP